MRYAFAMNAHKVLSHHYLTIFTIHTHKHTMHESVSILATASAPDQDPTEHCILLYSSIAHLRIYAAMQCMVAGLHCTFIQHFYGEENAKCELRFASEPMFLFSSSSSSFLTFLLVWLFFVLSAVFIYHFVNIGCECVANLSSLTIELRFWS